MTAIYIIIGALLVLSAGAVAFTYFAICPKIADALLKTIPPEQRDFCPDEGVPRPNTSAFFRQDEWYLKESGREKVTLVAKDGVLLCGNVFRAKGNVRRWAVVMHGYRIDAREMSEFIRRFYENGWNVLAPDQRAHGFSGGAYTFLGAMEKYDLAGWADFICKEDPAAEIVFFGGSMGAATVLLATGLPLPENVKAAVADSSFTSAKRLAARFLKWKKIPVFPLLPLTFRHVRRKTGVDLRDADVLAAVRRSVTPTLFLHGDQDAVVPFDMLNELYSEANCEKKKVVCAGAQHTQGYSVAPDLYWKEVFGFCENALSRSRQTEER